MLVLLVPALRFIQFYDRVEVYHWLEYDCNDRCQTNQYAETSQEGIRRNEIGEKEKPKKKQQKF